MNTCCKFIVVSFLLGQALCVVNHSKDLYNYLFRGEKHTSDIIPICHRGDNISLSVDVALRELVELNEKFQLVRIKLWVRLKWNDCTKTWRPGDYGGQDRITVPPYGRLWMPDLTLYEASSDQANMPDMKEYRASVMYDGNVSYNFPTIITSVCRIDVTYFPYDHQNCSLTFSSWMYNSKTLDLTMSSADADTDHFVPHNEWDLRSMKSYRKLHRNKDCHEIYPQIVYYMVLARFPKFYLLTLFFPFILVSMLSLLGFLLPPSSDEKLSLQITNLLTNVVFLFLVQDKLPLSSDTFPYIGVYFSVSMFGVCMSCIMSGIIRYVYSNRLKSEHFPHWARQLILDKFRSVLFDSNSVCNKDLYKCGKNEMINTAEAADRKSSTNTVRNLKKSNRSSRCQTFTVMVKDINGGKEGETEELQGQTTLRINEWEHLAFVLDRIFFILYIAFAVVNFCSFVILLNT